jgi:hypothetical protein
MNSKWTFKEILERFERIEKKLCLDEAVIQGVPWWDMLRQTIFDELLFELIEKEEIKNRIFVNNEFKKKKFLLFFAY